MTPAEAKERAVVLWDEARKAEDPYAVLATALLDAAREERESNASYIQKSFRDFVEKEKVSNIDSMLMEGVRIWFDRIADGIRGGSSDG